MTTNSVRAITSAHHSSFDGAEQRRGPVLMRLYGPALVVVVALAVLDLAWPTVVELSGTVGEILAAGLSLLAGLLFALGVTVLEKAIEMDHAALGPGRTTSQDAMRLRALSANALFTSILAGAGTAALIAASLLPSIRSFFTLLAIGFVVAVGTSGLKVSTRIFAETAERTTRARTGISQSRRGTGDHPEGQ